PEELEREKGVIVEEINMYKDMPQYEIENVLEGAMWPKEALGRDIAGSKQTVTKFNRNMFADYMKRHYQTPNIILGVSGKYNATTLDKLVKKYWSNKPKHSFHRHNAVTEKQKDARIELSYKDTEQAHLAFGFRGLAFKDRKNYAAQVLSAILGGGMSSRL